jgi:hypothetical protein
VCFNCGEPADDYDWIGRQRVCVCSSWECHADLENEQKAEEADAREEAHRRVDEEFGW